MDLAIYINELLGLQGEVNVPGIGVFSQKRVNGYYNEADGKFYPPHHEIVFDPEPTEDSGLADYISQKKNISPASAKYFIEKYAAGIQQEASSQSATITGLGILFYEYSTLTFKADKNAQANDPAFYGLAPVEPYKATEAAVVEDEPLTQDAAPVDEQAEEIPAAVETPVWEGPAEEEVSDINTDEEQPGYEYVEEEPRSGGRKWVVILLVIMVLLLAFGVSYQYKPEWFGKKRPVDTTIIINGPPPAPVKKQDTVKNAAPQDTTAKTAVVDTFAIRHYDILGGAFKSLPKVNEALKNYTSLGLKPRLLKHALGNYYKITLGTYFNKADAQRTHDSILNITGINKKFIYIQPYIPKKK